MENPQIAFVLGPLAALSASFTWAVATQKFSELSRSYHPARVSLTRGLVGSGCFFITLLLITFFSNLSWSDLITGFEFRHFKYYLLSMLASYALGDLSFFKSSHYLGVSSSLAIACTYPILTTLFGALFNHDIPTLIQIGGLIAAVFGIVLIVRSRAKPHEFDHTRAAHQKSALRKGLFLAVLAGFGWALNAFFTSKSAIGGPHVLFACFSRMSLAALLCIFTAKASSGLYGKPLPLKVIKTSWWLFVIESYFGTILYFYGFKNSPLTLGTVLTSLAPLIVLGLEVFSGREKLSFKKLLGVSSCVLGVIILSIYR